MAFVVGNNTVVLKRRTQASLTGGGRRRLLHYPTDKHVVAAAFDRYQIKADREVTAGTEEGRGGNILGQPGSRAAEQSRAAADSTELSRCCS